MSRGSPQPNLPKLLPDAAHAVAGAEITPAHPPGRQLSELSQEDLEATALELGLKPRKYKSRQLLIGAIHDRRQLIAGLDRQAMLDVLKWAGRSVPVGTSKEAIAHEITRLRAMRFGGLSQRGLVALATLRGITLRGDEDVPKLVRRLKRQEGILAKLNRQRRSILGKIVSNMIGDKAAAPPEQVLSDDDATARIADRPAGAARASIKDEIEEAGLLGGLAGRIKKSADSYLNQKLDEIEARIDRKLDEIDRRLAEWRDKEIANRLKILKITLWASVIVGIFSLMYSYVKVYLVK